MSASSTNTSLSVSVVDGSTITWRITDSFDSGDFTNMVVETQNKSSEVDCDPNVVIRHHLVIVV